MTKQASRAQPVLQKVLRRLRPQAARVLLSLLLAAATVALGLYVPVLIGGAIDLIAGRGQVDFQGVLSHLYGVSALVAANALLQWVLRAVNNRMAFDLVRDLRCEAFARLNQVPLGYLDQNAHGAIVSRVIADVDQLADGLLLGFAQMFTGVLTILGTLLFMLLTDFRIALVVVVLTPLSLFVARFIAGKTYAMFRLEAETRAEQTALIDERIAGQKVVQAFSREAETLSLFDEVNGRLETCSVRATFFSSLTNPTTRFVNSLVYAAVAAAGALACVATGGAFSVGKLTYLLSYAGQYAKPFNEISGVLAELQNALACAARIFEVIEAEPEASDAQGEALAQVSGRVDLEGVRFSYAKDRELIRNLSLAVRPGQRIALVGPTGCGKTTVINLLMRFYDVDRGGIRVEGRDIRSLTRQSLRQSYGMVLQDTWLKAGTIRENLILGKPNATDAEIVAAARAAHAHGFIKRLPKGYDTWLKEGGGSLSQGEKQLLCIARVMLRLPPMLILDEATSSIDTRTEIKIQEAFARMMQGRTSFIVAHRLSTIRQADVILVMRDGNVVEQGSHRALLTQNGFYARLYNSQFPDARPQPLEHNARGAKEGHP